MEIKIDTDIGDKNYSRIVTTGCASIYFQRVDKERFHISTEYEVTDDDSDVSVGWFFEERDLREAAELFLRLADQLAEEQGQ